MIPPETVWACTTCGWCETACPVFIENIPRLVDMRRHQVQVEAAFPDEAARVFKGIETQGNPWGIGSNKRAEWCEDLDVPRAADGGELRVPLLRRLRRRLRRPAEEGRAARIVQILREAGVTFAILGEEETCTGDAARRLGNEYLFQMQASANVETLERPRGEEDPHAVPALLQHHQERVPEFGGSYEVVHHAELIARAGRRRAARARRGRGAGRDAVTYHDPCYLGPLQRRLRGAARGARRRPGLDAGGDAAQRAGGLLLRRRRRPDVDGGEDRHAHQPEPGRRGAATLGAAGGVVATGCPFCLTMMKDGINETGREETHAGDGRRRDRGPRAAEARGPGRRSGRP